MGIDYKKKYLKYKNKYLEAKKIYGGADNNGTQQMKINAFVQNIDTKINEDDLTLVNAENYLKELKSQWSDVNEDKDRLVLGLDPTTIFQLITTLTAEINKMGEKRMGPRNLLN